jgi:signal peptidase II
MGQGLSLRRVLLSFALIASCIGCDQWTKRIAVQTLKDHPPVHLLNGLIQLIYAENTGAWGSLGAGWPPALKLAVFIVLPLAVLASIAAHMIRVPAIDGVRFVAYGLLVGGGAGNIIDRITTGYVVDFMWMGVGRLATNIFNVADLAVVIGVLLLLLPIGPRQRADAPAPT